MLKLGFALEGNSDHPIIPRLSHRVILEKFPDISLADDSILRPRKKGHGFISELPTFARQLRLDDVDILIAVVDTDNTHVRERHKLLQIAKQKCEDQGIPICIADGLAVRKLEAWLLADSEAIFHVFDGDKRGVTFPPPEEEADPKSTLNRIVRTLTEGREVTFASFAEELSTAIDLQVLRKRCKHFDNFASTLLDCVKAWQRTNNP